MNDTGLEQSEKDMIGSLLDDNESECSEYRSSLTRSQKYSQCSPIKGIRDSPEIRDDINLGNKDQVFTYQEFPSVDPNNYYISNLATPESQMRQHSMSHEANYINQYLFHQQQPIQNYYTPFQDLYFSQKRIRKQPVVDINEQSIALQCQDQYASLAVQQSFVNGNEQQREFIFKGMEEDLVILSKHKFGNYVVQKVIEHGTNQMRSIVFCKLIANLIEMCYDKFGCRVIQKLLEYITIKKQEKCQFISQVKPNLMTLIFDQCGNHVIQKLIDLVPTNETDFIIEIVTNNVEQIISHPYGCRIAQKCLETYPNISLLELYSTLTPLIDTLSYCQYGNYIVQHMIMQGPRKCVEVIGAFIKNNFLKVSQDKFASNVAQRFIIKTEEEEIIEISKQIMSLSVGPMPALLLLINNQFGNYVMQNLFTRCNDKWKNIIQLAIKKYEEPMFTTYGRHFLQYMARITC